MIDSISLPDKLTGSAKVTSQFQSRQIDHFYEAIQHVHQLPYGRNTQRDDYLLVLDEKQGTCSTKHALIKTLADEQQISCTLKLGIFSMTHDNTPGIAPVLNNFKLTAIPEAHCFLEFNQQRLDLTFPDKNPNSLRLNFLVEESITPAQIGAYKIQLHQNFIRNWIKRNQIQCNFNTVWACREACIQALYQSCQVSGIKK